MSIDRNAVKLALGETVAAKLRYWDRLRELETILTEGSDFSDKANDAVIDMVDLIAASIDDADSAVACIEDQYVNDVLAIVERHPGE